MDIHYVVADGQGIEHFTETHTFGLWTQAEYLEAFERAGCEAWYVSDTLSGYGMFMARNHGGSADRRGEGSRGAGTTYR